MKTRHVYTTPDLAGARRAVAAARDAGVADDGILLVARSDIELDAIPDNRKEADSDMLPAAARGAGLGAGAGLLAGLVAVAIPPLGVTLAGAAAATLAGAAVGSWSGALMGSSLPDPVRRRFEERIQAGEVLVVVDVPAAQMERVDRQIAQSGAVRLPFEAPSAAS